MGPRAKPKTKNAASNRSQPEDKDAQKPVKMSTRPSSNLLDSSPEIDLSGSPTKDSYQLSLDISNSIGMRSDASELSEEEAVAEEEPEKDELVEEEEQEEEEANLEQEEEEEEEEEPLVEMLPKGEDYSSEEGEEEEEIPVVKKNVRKQPAKKSAKKIGNKTEQSPKPKKGPKKNPPQKLTTAKKSPGPKAKEGPKVPKKVPKKLAKVPSTSDEESESSQSEDEESSPKKKAKAKGPAKKLSSAQDNEAQPSTSRGTLTDLLTNLVIEALEINTDRKGATIQAIRKHIMANDDKGREWKKLAPNVKKSIEKGLESNIILRPKGHSEALSALQGRFKVNRSMLMKAKAKRPIQRATPIKKPENKITVKKTSAKFIDQTYIVAPKKTAAHKTLDAQSKTSKSTTGASTTGQKGRRKSKSSDHIPLAKVKQVKQVKKGQPVVTKKRSKSVDDSPIIKKKSPKTR